MTKRKLTHTELNLINTGISEESITSTTTRPFSTNFGDSASKYIQLEPEKYAAHAPVVCCSLPPHRTTFSFYSFEEYEVHYAKIHVNRCSVCGKNFPTDHILSLHIEENHNSLFELRQERGDKMYACFVEDCDRRCSTPKKRRMHLIDKHLYPKDYDFYIINHGISNRSSLLKSWNDKTRGSASTHRTRSNVANTTKPKTIINQPTSTKFIEDGIPITKNNKDFDELSSAMSSLRFVPPSVRSKIHEQGRV